MKTFGKNRMVFGIGLVLAIIALVLIIMARQESQHEATCRNFYIM